MKLKITYLAAAVMMASAWTANAGLLFDRGLPLANLNDAAGANRSNVQWADGESTDAHNTFWLPGDDFTIAGSGAFNVNKISVWTTSYPLGLNLLGGLAGGSITVQSTSFEMSVVSSYGGGQGYQGNSGGYSPVYQIDFNVSIPLNGGQKYQFFLDGPASWYSGASWSGYVNAFLHASNGALSGSPQEGADDTFLWRAPDGSVQTWLSSGGGTTGWGAGWDKNSDANVQVFGTPVPEPSTYIAGALMLLPFGMSAVRMLRKKA